MPPDPSEPPGGLTRVVHILRSPTANLISVAAAVRRADAAPVMTDAPTDVSGAERLIVPGVGSFGAMMSWLNFRGITEPLRARLAVGAPTLAICLGMQVLFESSEESPGVRGLGVIPGVVRRFETSDLLRVPQMGWNRVEPQTSFVAQHVGFAYFANSYRVSAATSISGWSSAISDHGGPFLAAIQSVAAPRIVGCQFHPELSGSWGLNLLRRWAAC
jgi:imidazole glycerol phosphate synthase glutamine amidotransferase subunit